MAKHPGKCPKCGGRLEFDTAVDEQIVCPHCLVSLSLPGKAKASDQVDPLLGRSLGQFELLEVIGRGGMGAVYKARQASLDRTVAIKVLPQRFARDASFVERFYREARAAAAVSHPNIIEVFDVGEDRGYQYIAMELIDGESLAAVLKREGRLAPDRALDILKQTAAALAEAHACGILHRDIKPANILLTSRGRVKVADFGLAKHEGVDVSVTITGQTLGTPLYMPPEAARGEQLDARSDLYSLGATFYQALAGKPPFDGTTPAELVVKHIEAAAPPLGQLVPDCPPALARIIHRLLRKRPAERYASADKLLQALARVEARMAAATAPSSLSRRERAGVRGPVSSADATKTLAPTARHTPGRAVGAGPRGRTALIGGLAAALVLVLVLVLLLVRPGKRPPSAVAPPGPPAPGTRHLEPGPRADPAESAWQHVQSLAAEADWPAARAAFDRFESTYWRGRFYAAHRREIDSLRQRIDAALKSEPSPDDELWTEWEDLFDGKTLNGWRIAEGAAFARRGSARVERGWIILEEGESATCIVWSGSFPREGYEVAFETMREAATGDFGTTLFPVGSSSCLLGIAAYGGKAGLSWVDGKSCADNVTTRRVGLDGGRWYAVRLRVTAAKIEAWIDQQQVVDFVREGHTLTAPPDFTTLGAFSLSSLRCTSALRNIRLRRLRPEPPPDDERWTEWEDLFDGKTLKGWNVLDGGAFAGHGDVRVRDGELTLTKGADGTGIVWAGNFPTTNYALDMEVRSAEPSEFGIVVFPVGASRCRLILNSLYHVVGLDLVDGLPVHRNTTTKPLHLEPQRLYRTRLQVTDAKVEVWIDDAKAIDVDRAAHTFSVRSSSDPVKPFGLETWMGDWAARSIRLRRLKPEPLPDDDQRWTEWEDLFDGRSLEHWRVVATGVPAQRGRAAVRDGRIAFEAGSHAAIAWAGSFPTEDYEVLVDLTYAGPRGGIAICFPVAPSRCSFRMSWSGDFVALQTVDGRPSPKSGASVQLEPDRPYRVRLRVTKASIGAWVNERGMIAQSVAGHKLNVERHLEPVTPFGIWARGDFATSIRTIRLRRLKPSPPPDDDERWGAWESLFDGKTLGKWQPIKEFPSPKPAGVPGKGGPVEVKRGEIVLDRNQPRTGIVWGGEFPMVDYEVAIAAQRTAGRETFCHVVFPVGDAACTLDVGTLGGNGAGLGLVDGLPAHENLTSRDMALQSGQHYRVRLRVLQGRIQAWIDADQLIDLATAGHTLAAPRDLTPAKPFGITAINTQATIKSVHLRRLKPDPLDDEARWTEWQDLFDGKTLKGWRAVERFPEGKGGPARVADGQIMLEPGNRMSGIAWTEGFPEEDYELEIIAARLAGTSDFCTVNFPVGSGRTTLVCGGGGKEGNILGVDHLYGKTVTYEKTSRQMQFETGRWYTVRLRVTADKVGVWLDGVSLLELRRAEHTFVLWSGRETGTKLAVLSWDTTAALRSIRLRRLKPGPAEAEPWISLFDGKTLKGWKRAGGKAYVEDGALVSVGDTDLLYEADWSECVLECELQGSTTRGTAICCLQLGHTAMGRGNHRVRLLFHRTGEVEVQGPDASRLWKSRHRAFPLGDWLRLRVEMTRGKLVISVDGKPVHTLDIAAIPVREGGVCFFAYAGATARLRNVRARGLSPKAAAPRDDAG